MASGGVQPGQLCTNGTGGAHVAQQVQTFEDGAGIVLSLLSCSLSIAFDLKEGPRHGSKGAPVAHPHIQQFNKPAASLTTPGLMHSSQCPSLGHMPFLGQWVGQVSLNYLNGKPPNRASGVATKRRRVGARAGFASRGS